MKYYSETLKQLFDTEDALLSAEVEAAKEKAAKEETKKSVAKEIEDAEVAVDNAYKALEEAKKVCAEILESSNKQVSDILENAKRTVADAEEARASAIKKFNKQFGPYQANYSGERAVREAERVNKLINGMFGLMFP